MLAIRQLNKRFGHRVALNNISLRVAAGESVVVCGPSGAGKTTLLSIIAGTLPPSSGQITINKTDTTIRTNSLRRLIGFLPENCPLYNDLTVEEHLIYRGHLKGLRGRRMRARLRSVIECSRLENIRYRLIGQLSLGERQRIGIADLLLTEPRLLLLDDPFTGLDHDSSVKLASLLNSYRSRHNTLLIATHRLDLATSFSDRCLLLTEGCLASSIPLKESSATLLTAQITQSLTEFKESRDRMVLE